MPAKPFLDCSLLACFLLFKFSNALIKAFVFSDSLAPFLLSLAADLAIFFSILPMFLATIRSALASLLCSTGVNPLVCVILGSTFVSVLVSVVGGVISVTPTFLTSGFAFLQALASLICSSVKPSALRSSHVFFLVVVVPGTSKLLVTSVCVASAPDGIAIVLLSISWGNPSSFSVCNSGDIRIVYACFMVNEWLLSIPDLSLPICILKTVSATSDGIPPSIAFCLATFFSCLVAISLLFIFAGEQRIHSLAAPLTTAWYI